MSLAPPTVAELASFTGRDENTFTSFAVQALDQATLLFYLATSLSEYPEDDPLEKLAKYGIMDMADKIYLSQPYAEATASPYQSETIGSYSYSKGIAAVRKGDATGVMWFDLAVNKLKAAGSGIGASGSISAFEWDGVAVDGDGKVSVIGATGSHQFEGNRAWEIDTAMDVTHHHPMI
jgi:hypothetical protein